MRTSWNGDEDDALQGLPLRAQIIYLRGIRRYMDYNSRICGGPQRRISLCMLAEITQEAVNRQLLPKVSKDGVRASLDQLKRAGLIMRVDDPDYLIFFLPKADGHKSVCNNHPTTAPQPAHSHNLSAQTVPAMVLPINPSSTTHPRSADNHPTHQLSVFQDSVSDVTVAQAVGNKSIPPYDLIVSLYHECLPGLPKVYKLNDGRRRHIRALWQDELDDLQSWRNYFRHVGRSDFLMGRVSGRDGSVFVASFDFIIHPVRFIKIAEEQYHGKKIQRG